MQDLGPDGRVLGFWPLATPASLSASLPPSRIRCPGTSAFPSPSQEPGTPARAHGSALSAGRAMMMTACDLSAITKPWEVQSKVRPGWPDPNSPFQGPGSDSGEPCGGGGQNAVCSPAEGGQGPARVQQWGHLVPRPAQQSLRAPGETPPGRLCGVQP